MRAARRACEPGWKLCEGCDTRVPDGDVGPSERDGEPLCSECRAIEESEDEPRYEGPVDVTEGWR